MSNPITLVTRSLSSRSLQDDGGTNLNHFVVILLRYSTQRLYEDSERYALHICSVNPEDGMPNISVEVAGENLVVACFFPGGIPTSYFEDTDNLLHVFDWRKGTRKGEPFPIENTGLTFLREDILLHPNTKSEFLGVYHIPPSSSANKQPELIHSLILPTLLPNRQITQISCRSDPKPTSGGRFPSHTRKERPFAHNPEDAVVIFTLTVGELYGDGLGGVRKRFAMIVHRSSLLDAIAHSLPSSAPPSSTPKQTPYSAWGPPVTRWFAANEFSTMFITTTSGQRCVQYVPGERVRRGLGAPAGAVQDEDLALDPDTIQVLDLNPWHVKLTRHVGNLLGVGGLLGVVGERVSSSRLDDDFEDDPSNVLPPCDTFKEAVVGRLPYVVSSNEEKWDYEAVLLDEERIVGVRVSPYYSDVCSITPDTSSRISLTRIRMEASTSSTLDEHKFRPENSLLFPVDVY